MPQQTDDLQSWFDQRWQTGGHKNYFAGPENGMLMTTGFWHMRSRHFPRPMASKMTQSWALDRDKGFMGEFFPLAMARQSMKQFASDVDQSFGYTPDTAYFTLSGMFQQRLGRPAWRLTLNHLEHYNFNSDWGLPVAPEAYTRDRKRFGDQYSNFNAGKLLLYLEGLAGIEYSLPENRFIVHDTMPECWEWMEFRVPIKMPGEAKTHWPVVRYQRRGSTDITKTIRVSDCPLAVTIEPWTEGKPPHDITCHPKPITPPITPPIRTRLPDYKHYTFPKSQTSVKVTLRLRTEQ